MTIPFDRTVVCEIGQPGEDGRRFEDLRIGGTVEKSRSGDPNTADVEIINASPDSVAEAQRDGAAIRVLAGYDIPRLIFDGDINRDGVIVEMQGPDRVLRIEAQDGGRSLRRSHIEASFAAEMTAEEIFEEVADQMGVPLGTVDLGDDDVRWNRGRCFSAPARSVLDQLVAVLGADWSIQDRTLQIIPRGDDTKEEAVVVSADNNNLIGKPKPTDDGLEITALLDGRIRPGRRVVLESRDFDGTYRVDEVTHQFDSGWEDSFYSVVTGREV